MEKNLAKGDAVVLGDESTNIGLEYLVINHGRQGPKFRVMFDFAAKFRGNSLKDSLLSGPALQTSFS